MKHISASKAFNSRKINEIGEKQNIDPNQKTNKQSTQVKEKLYSPRGRQTEKNNKNYKNSAYKTTTSSRSRSNSNPSISNRNRRGRKQVNYYSDTSDNPSDLNFNIISKLNKMKNANHKSIDIKSNSKSISGSNQNKKNCSCCKCHNDEIEDDEENKLPQEIYQILIEVYEAHINNQNIIETVKKYHQSVYEFCLKEEQQEIIYFVRLFSEKVIEAMKVS
jgi:hypothetical protein